MCEAILYPSTSCKYIYILHGKRNVKNLTVFPVAGAEGLWFAGQVRVGVREQQAAVAELQVQPEDPGEDVQVGVHQQGHGPPRPPLRRPHRHPLIHAGRRAHQRPPRLVPAPPRLLLRRRRRRPR